MIFLKREINHSSLQVDNVIFEKLESFKPL